MGIWANFIKSDFEQKIRNKLSFPTRMLVVATVVLMVVNLIEFYGIKRLALDFVLEVSIVEVVILAINFAFWVPRYNLKWGRNQ